MQTMYTTSYKEGTKSASLNIDNINYNIDNRTASTTTLTTASTNGFISNINNKINKNKVMLKSRF